MKMTKWILLFVVLCAGCTSTGKVETSLNPYEIEKTQVKVIVEFK